jgi:hypothetical protein
MLCLVQGITVSGGRCEMKRKILYVILIIAVELLKPNDLNAAGTTEITGANSSSPYISLTQAEYQDLLKYKFVYQYEKDYAASYSEEGQATSLREANDMIQARDKALDQKDAEIMEKLQTITEQQKQIDIMKKATGKWHWSAGGSFAQDQAGQIGFSMDVGIGYSSYMPYAGLSWHSETGWGYSVGLRYYR